MVGMPSVGGLSNPYLREYRTKSQKISEQLGQQMRPGIESGTSSLLFWAQKHSSTGGPQLARKLKQILLQTIPTEVYQLVWENFVVKVWYAVSANGIFKTLYFRFFQIIRHQLSSYLMNSKFSCHKFAGFSSPINFPIASFDWNNCCDIHASDDIVCKVFINRFSKQQFVVFFVAFQKECFKSWTSLHHFKVVCWCYLLWDFITNFKFYLTENLFVSKV